LTENENELKLWNEEIEKLRKIEKEIPNFKSSRLICTLDDRSKKLKDKYMIMELIEGRNLEYFYKRNLASKFNDEIDFIRMALILSQQLSYLHSNDIIHGDIKRRNIMFIEKSKNYFYYLLFIYIFIYLFILYLFIYFIYYIYFYLFYLFY
jgi:serine/threonine protein kinase